ncbi:hypothetical protein C8Q74DRAFT_1299053 [Fomes fomentarius]|nr:hypothetical protein C8Q74DRAFT_1299053 [Fomes fomentarius]
MATSVFRLLTPLFLLLRPSCRPISRSVPEEPIGVRAGSGKSGVGWWSELVGTRYESRMWDVCKGFRTDAG